MHGRVKVRTSEEQALAKQKEREQKLKVYQAITGKIFEKRKQEDFDEESLELTAGILIKNPEFYTWWNYRREILIKLKLQKTKDEFKKLCLIELDLTENCLRVSPKSYATWHHRLWVMEFNPDADWKRELKLCNFFLSQDDRNFHCWDYRRILCKKCEISPEEELAYSTELIETNFSNYSAWHYRSKLLPIVHKDPDSGNIKEDVRLKEFELIQNAAFTDPDDQSVWFYHRWLLGRSQTSLHIMNISILKPQNMVAVLLSRPYKVNSTCMKLLVNDTPVSVEWKPVSSIGPLPTVWLCELPKELPLSGDIICKVTAELIAEDEKSSLSCRLDGNSLFSWQNIDRMNTFSSSLSAATKEVLENELESCQQLNELEPNCKWTVFTCILLMRALDHQKFETEISGFLLDLMKIDFKRENYYKDLRSKFVIEDVIESLPVNTTEVNLSHRNLTCLYHTDHFLLLEKIDLSSNQLRSTNALSYLISAKSIVLDDNEISSLEGLKELGHLEVLSARNNLIIQLHVVEGLKTCCSLRELILSGNPVTEHEEFDATIKLLPSLMCSN